MKNGFTLIEILLVIGIATILLGLSTINLVKVQHNTTIGASVDTLTADIKSQQAKAMSGASFNGTANGAYGIYFSSSNSYTLFHGNTYDPTDLFNMVVTTDDPIVISSSFPNNSLVFEAVSGNVMNFSSGSRTITVVNTAGGEQKVFTINQYGVISDIQ